MYVGYNHADHTTISSKSFFFPVNNVCLIKIRSKHGSNTLLCLLRFFMKQTLNQKIDKVEPSNSNSFYFSLILVAVFFGFWCCISLSPLCIVAGIWQICAGLFVITLEAPFCCMFLDFVQKAVAKVDGRPTWQKALVYLV